MRVSEGVVIGARLGGRAEFAQIVRAYEASLYSFALASTRNRAEAEDSVQDIFLKLLSGIRDLREPGRLEAWLWAVARNELAGRGRARRTGPAEAELDLENLAEAEGRGGRGSLGTAEDLLLEGLFARLGPEETLILSLRYGGGLSVRELALVLGIPESTAKSRLHELRERLRALARLGRGEGPGPGLATTLRPFRIPFGLEERIMENVETLRLGAFIVERLAHGDQMHLAIQARLGEAFDERTLAALGRVEGGAELVRRTGTLLGVKDLASILNYTDRYTEIRIIEGLETLDPETSEALKRSMFVFDDFVLFDSKALALLLDTVGDTVIALGLCASSVAIREEILAKVEGPRQESLRAALATGAWSPEAGRAAQEEAVAFARRLAEEGSLRVLQGEEYPRGWTFTLSGNA